jgi:hypothetical protein
MTGNEMGMAEFRRKDRQERGNFEENPQKSELQEFKRANKPMEINKSTKIKENQ